MTKYIIKRFLGMIPTLLIITTVAFIIMRIAPGGPFDRERAIPEAVRENIEKRYNLDKSLPEQYLIYLGGIIRGDFGPSYKYRDQTVTDLIFNSLPHSLILGTLALLVATFFGVLAGIIAALNQNTWIDYTAMSIAVFGVSVPAFVIGPVLMLIFAMKLKILPTSGWITGPDGWVTVIMPLIALSMSYFASIARLSRSSVLEVVRSDYVRTAKAKGLSPTMIILKHVLKGAMLPVVSYLGIAYSGIITGSVVIEQIFRIPGLGRFFVQSSLNRDYTMIMGVIIVYSTIVILMNFLVDILYSFLDPRISYQ
ncbi:ABC transporter permease [Spirochaeta isovalerica]|uniref:Oligopeptide transport system permease protein n=1 Tax=Spirochaeta isovalerica TaxID=150 RepID=A0A841RB27_9SPIO|nr:ABC transporter permease subunit [Spirochaeta isovalerica]MBB6481133.1 oligopeptide transport system permease protein [Spirochaeta isovalerica]